eukprot:403366988
MDNLINRWKQTVENHNRKLSQLREESLGRSVSKDRSMFISKESLNQSVSQKLLPQTDFKNQKNLEMSERKPSPFRDLNLIQISKENKAPSVNYEKLCPKEDEQFLLQYVDQIIAMFPETKLKSKKRQKLLDLLSTHYQLQFKSLSKNKRELKSRDQEKRENQHINEATSKRMSELESKLQDSERERLKIRQERDELLRQYQSISRDHEDKTQQSQVMSMLRRTQETLEISNQKLEQMFIDNKKRFREKEEVWEQELGQLRQDMQIFEVKSKQSNSQSQQKRKI